MLKIPFYLFLVLLVSCTQQKNETKIIRVNKTIGNHNTIIVDCKYTFEEAIQGSNAPKEIVEQLKLINVQYYSTDHRIHQGQILTNETIAGRVESIFKYLLSIKFPIAHAIPIVKYNWDDELSMQANNTYSFCYRDISYSKHAKGMAIDINPLYNPERWKEGYKYRTNEPSGANYDPHVPGTFYKLHPAVEELKKLGFRWGHNFTAKFDDHHFEI